MTDTQRADLRKTLIEDEERLERDNEDALQFPEPSRPSTCWNCGAAKLNPLSLCGKCGRFPIP